MGHSARPRTGPSDRPSRRRPAETSSTRVVGPRSALHLTVLAPGRRKCGNGRPRCTRNAETGDHGLRPQAGGHRPAHQHRHARSTAQPAPGPDQHSKPDQSPPATGHARPNDGATSWPDRTGDRPRSPTATPPPHVGRPRGNRPPTTGRCHRVAIAWPNVAARMTPERGRNAGANPLAATSRRRSCLTARSAPDGIVVAPGHQEPAPSPSVCSPRRQAWHDSPLDATRTTGANVTARAPGPVASDAIPLRFLGRCQRCLDKSPLVELILRSVCGGGAGSGPVRCDGAVVVGRKR